MLLAHVDDPVALLARVYHPQIGLVRDINEVPRYPDGAPLVVMNATCANPERFCGPPAMYRPKSMLAAGAAVSRRDALFSVIGEAIERYAAGIYFDEEFVVASEKELTGRIFP